LAGILAAARDGAQALHRTELGAILVRSREALRQLTPWSPTLKVRRDSLQTTRSALIPGIVGIIVAIAALVVAIIAIHENQTATTRIHILQAQLRAATPALSKASSNVSVEQGKITALESSVAKLASLTGKVDGIESCLPELQSELSSLEIKGETYSASYINNPSHTLLACNKILYTSDH
jgi:hypothetical protein